MLGGVDYYPSKPKKGSSGKWWIFALIALALAGAGYFASHFFLKTSTTTPKKTIIVINKAKKDIEAPSSVIIKSDTYQPITDQRVKSTLGLDEIIQKFEQR